jgi:hypothetical protein
LYDHRLVMKSFLPMTISLRFATCLALCLNVTSRCEALIAQQFWDTDGPVLALHYDQNHQRVFIGGAFSAFGPVVKGSSFLARASSGQPVTGFPHTYASDTSVGDVTAVDSDGDGGWYISGNFNWAGASRVHSIIHIKSDMTLDQDWNPTIDSAPTLLKFIDPWIYISGVGIASGEAVHGIARLNKTDGRMDLTWVPQLSGVADTMLINGNLMYLSGTLTPTGLATRYALALNLNDATLAAWNPQLDGPAYSIAHYNSQIYLGGAFEHAGAQAIDNFVIVDETTAAVVNATLPADGLITDMEVDGTRLLLAGNFTMFGGAARSRTAAIDLTNSNLLAWEVPVNQIVIDMALSGGDLYLGGAFTQVDNSDACSVAKVDAATGALHNWHPVSGMVVKTLACDGLNVLIGGVRSQAISPTRANLACIDFTTGEGTSWAPEANDQVNALCRVDDVIYIGGEFTNVEGNGRNYLAAIDANTGACLSWDPNPNGVVHNIKYIAGKLYVCGNFATIAGQARAYVCCFDPSDGSLLGWAPQPDGVVRDVALDNDGNVFFGGDFTAVNGFARQKAARVDPAGTLHSWAPIFNDSVYSLSIQDSRILVGGKFTDIGGLDREYFARLDSATGIPDDVSINIRSRGAFPCIFGSQAIGSYLWIWGDFWSISNRGSCGTVALHTSDGTREIDPYPFDTGIGTTAAHIGSNFVIVGATIAGRNFSVVLRDDILDDIPNYFIANNGWIAFGLAYNRSSRTLEDLSLGGRDVYYYDALTSEYRLVTGVIPPYAGLFVRATGPLDILLQTPDPDTGTVAVPLSSGWNLISVPVGHAVEWSLDDIFVIKDEETKSLGDAQDAGWMDGCAWFQIPDSDEKEMIYDSSVIPDANPSLLPWRGYWVHANTDCNIVFRLSGSN